MTSHASSNQHDSKLIMEGFICPECQLDMSSIEMLQAHFESAHMNTNKNNGSSKGFFRNSSQNELSLSSPEASKTGLSSVIAMAKTLMFDQTNDNDSNSDATMYVNNSSSQRVASSSSLKEQQTNLNMNSTNKSSYSYMKQFFDSGQSTGYSRSHTEEFKKMRDNSIGHFIVQTNKLLIILEKLISVDINIYMNDNKRETYYKSIVPWVKDKDVQLCPYCAKSFNLIFRKHHCRLCGAILCNKCSQFISFASAEQLTNIDSAIVQSNRNLSKTEFKIKRADSMTSVNSYFGGNSSESGSVEKSGKIPKKDQMFLRLCGDCGRILEKKFKSFKDNASNNKFTSKYDELQSSISESRKLYPIYTKMVDSLSIGETVYQLENVENTRHRLIKLFKDIESFSAIILKYDSNITNSDGKPIVSNDQIKLQRNIRLYSVNYLREYSFNMPNLPTAEEYAKLKEQRQRYLIEEKRRSDLETQLKERRQSDKGENKSTKIVKRNSNISIDNANGWVPTVKPNIMFDTDERDEQENDEYNENLYDDDTRSITSKKSTNYSDQDKALRIQIQQVEAFYQEALKHKKFEEADLLKQNLNELYDALQKNS